MVKVTESLVCVHVSDMEHFDKRYGIFCMAYEIAGHLPVGILVNKAFN